MDRGHGAGNGGGGHDDSGNTANGVSASGNRGRGSGANGCGLRDGNGGRGERVSTGSRAGVDYGSRHDDDDAGCRGRRRCLGGGWLGRICDNLSLGLGRGGVVDNYSHHVSYVSRNAQPGGQCLLLATYE
jgi:hypothetical protein